MPTALFTKETAAEFARKSHAPGSARFLEKPTKSTLPESAQNIGKPASNYISKRLMRVRKQLDRVDRMMMTETDPAKLDRLASAQSRLSTQERELDGRPLLAAVKTSTKGSRSRQSEPTPLPEDDTTSE